MVTKRCFEEQELQGRNVKFQSPCTNSSAHTVSATHGVGDAVVSYSRIFNF
jgi:hypothetical protein